jgi:hypothetical protein
VLLLNGFPYDMHSQVRATLVANNYLDWRLRCSLRNWRGAASALS